MAEQQTIYEKLSSCQQSLTVGKNHYNEGGNYKYRTNDDILHALKDLLKELSCVILLSDKVVSCGERYYIESTATLVDTVTGQTVSCSASARESASLKDMDESQITGASTTYARKYALCGLLAIENGSKDADDLNNKNPQPAAPPQEEPAKVNSMEDALKVKVSIGLSRDKTIEEVYKSGKPNLLFWIANHDPIACDAAKVVIKNDAELMALCNKQ